MYLLHVETRLVGPLFEKQEATVTTSVKIAPPNSLLFISDIDGGEPPIPVLGAQILATGSCLSIACYPWIDGETAVTLGPSREVDPGTSPAFDGELETPSRTIVISTAEQKTILSDNVLGTRTRVRAWVNKPSMPDQVIIGFE
jgi:hypothetical protein